MNVSEYNKLKNKRNNAIQNLKCYKDPQHPLAVKWNTIVEGIDKQLEDAEQDSEVIEYKELIKKRTRFLQLIGSWDFYHKDSTKLKEQLNDIQKKIDELEKDDEPAMHLMPLESKPEPINKSEILAIINEVVHSNKVNAPSEPTYYIINLAWSRSEGDGGSKVINIVRDFLNESNWMDRSSQLSEERGESMLTWKYSYDSPEEQANAKSFRICASHLLDTMKKWFPDVTDAEIFGKVQKY